MAERGSLRQSTNAKGPVVFGPSVYDVPLLPFEKQLIETVNITEEEYRYFVSEAIRKGKTRPAGYELVPDIQAAESATVILSTLKSAWC